MLHTHMANKDVYIETEEKRTSVISTLDILTTQVGRHGQKCTDNRVCTSFCMGVTPQSST